MQILRTVGKIKIIFFGLWELKFMKF